MQTTSFRAAYATRIHRVITFITEHIDEELSLETLAKEAYFSPFHFHRIFTALVGETPNVFVNRLRVERAAWMLTHPGAKSITQIAFDCGFSSSAAFSRAFKQAFGVSPTEWRRSKDRKICKTDRKDWKDKFEAGNDIGLALRDEPQQQAHQWNVTITQMPRFHVAYVANLQGYRVEKIREAWQQLWQWASARDLWTAETLPIGISLDDPGITSADKCRYYVCIPVPEVVSGDQCVGVMDIAGGKYAVYRFEGTQPELHAAYHGLYSEWLPDSGFQLSDRPCYEICRFAPADPVKENMIMDIYLPVEPLQMW
ncbi:transcriptional regulator, AraC family [Candidatus Moduliflexus flocculans]|uniref:Transcriptional regulator, AraC family n=1 Tax=Candidatus Moduliflexus flocculans TaxID=1499966 RepID=A0A0S6W3N2_9BACT|nr:transcriptional regulator, AraC family [Candidatus Moduliflexus flocculans]